MICLLLIMTMVFINGTESAEQKIKHLDTLLKEEEMNAKTKAWLLMVESGKVDQDELRRITPKSIFIAPLLSSGAVKCKEGYSHDHLGQCVKVIKIDPKVQLELLLQRLNKLYGEKKQEKEVFEVSNGPLQFSLPISNAAEKVNASQNTTKSDRYDFNSTPSAIESNGNVAPEFIPIPLPLIRSNQTHEMESSGAEPLNDTAPLDVSEFEGSGVAASSGDGPLEEETTTVPAIGLLSDETDYVDANASESSESTTAAEIQSTTEPPEEILTTTTAEGNASDADKNNMAVTDAVKANTKEEIIPLKKEVFIKSSPKSDKIIFPDDERLRTPVGTTAQSGIRIRFPDEVAQIKAPGYHSDKNYNLDKYQFHTSVVPQEQFWWLPKNWQLDGNQQKSTLVKVWSRLPLIHDITYSQPIGGGLKAFLSQEQPFPQGSSPRYDEEVFPVGNGHHRSSGRSLRRFKTNHFQDMVQTQRQNFRIQR